LRATGGIMDRRRLLGIAAQLGVSLAALPLLGCESDSSPSDTPEPGSCSRIPQETAGPFPGDGSNGPNVLNQSGAVRSDIRSSFGGVSGVADGIPLTIVLNIVSATTCAALAGRAVYLWQCDRQGRYSLYTAGVTNQNYLRGVQAADANGRVTFTSIFPGCYAGRWPHIHFEVFPNLTDAASGANRNATSQIALPKASCDVVYATTGYETSVTNLSQVSLATDMVFSDGSALELATMTGSVASGLTATLTVAV
jgi:protocatechuate 3,4-dioxygenase beta subunit